MKTPEELIEIKYQKNKIGKLSDTDIKELMQEYAAQCQADNADNSPLKELINILQQEKINSTKPECKTLRTGDYRIGLDKAIVEASDLLYTQADNAEVIMNDKLGKPIKAGDSFTVDFLKELNNPIELVGSFDWHDGDLRYEIDIHDNEEYVCLSYVPEVMTNFKLI